MITDSKIKLRSLLGGLLEQSEMVKPFETLRMDLSPPVHLLGANALAPQMLPRGQVPRPPSGRLWTVTGGYRSAAGPQELQVP